MSPLDSRFARAGHSAAEKYDRRFRKYVPLSEIIDVLRRQTAFGIPLKFVLDRDPDSSWTFRRDPLWDFGNAGVRFEKIGADDPYPTLMVTWSADYEQKTLQAILEELDGLGFDEDAEISIELVSPSGERMLSRYGNGVEVKEDNAVVHFVGSWNK